jgi:hypothetical protein
MIAVRNECSAMRSGVVDPGDHPAGALVPVEQAISSRKLVRPSSSGSGIGAASLQVMTVD